MDKEVPKFIKVQWIAWFQWPQYNHMTLGCKATALLNSSMSKGPRWHTKGLIRRWWFHLSSSFWSEESHPLILKIAKVDDRASLVAQWLRIRLPMQGTWVPALVREDPTCRGATKPVCHKYWAFTLEPSSHSYWAHVPQLLKPARLEPVLHNKRSHHNEKPARSN